jgi:hypothetical protein
MPVSSTAVPVAVEAAGAAAGSAAIAREAGP